MNYFILKKIFAFLCSLLAIASLTFFLMKTIPGDPFSAEQSLTKETHEALMYQHGFHRSLSEQYMDYLFNLLKGDLGYSFVYPERTVNQIIAGGFATSAKLGAQAFIMSLLFGISLGLISALKYSEWEDHFIFILTTLSIAIPSFIVATLLQYSFAIYFPIFPIARWGTFSQTILPSLSLALGPIAFISRLIRGGLREVMQSDYIKLAHAKGLPFKTILWRHALPNAILPILTYTGPLLTNILMGSFIIEKIFSIPGLGQWLINSIAHRDYPLIMGLTLFYSFILLSAILLVDLLYGYFDPRIRLIKQEQ